MPSWLKYFLGFLIAAVLYTVAITQIGLLKTAVLTTGLVALLLFVYTLGLLGMFVFVLGQGRVAVVKAGGRHVRTLANVGPDWRVNEFLKVVPDPPDPITGKRLGDHGITPLGKFFRTTFGIYWVGIWPIYVVAPFRIERERLEQETELKKGDPLSKRIKKEKPKTVRELLWKIPRPFLVAGVELADGTRVNLIVMTTWQPEDPGKVIFDYNADIFRLLGARMSGSYDDKLRKYPYILQTMPTGRAATKKVTNFAKNTFVNLAKGPDSELAATVIAAVNDGYKPKPKRSRTPPPPTTPTVTPTLLITQLGTVGEMGLRLTSCWIEASELAEEDKTVADAAKALQIATKEGQAQLERARYQRDSDKARATGQAAIVNQLSEAYATNPDVAGAVSTQILSENLSKMGGKDSSLNTVVFGGLTPTLPVGGSSKKTP